MDMRKLIGRNFSRIRLEKGLTQETLSEKSGFTQQYLSGLEQGRRNPTILSLYEIALALEVDHVALVAPDEEARQEEARRVGGSSSAVGPARAKRQTRSRRAKIKARDNKKRSRPRA
jgi:transcriptional regulator with XRE-family HTH domain